MSKIKLFFRIFLLVSCFNSIAGAVDHSKTAVLVRYKTDPRFSNVKMNRVALLSALKMSTKLNEKEVFSQLSFPASRETLWIVNGTYAELTPEEMQRLLRHPLVASVSPMGRKAHVISKYGKIDALTDAKFTYGLEKIRVPELRLQDPTRDGRGVRVGILDTGLSGTHPSLSGKVSRFRDFVSNQSTNPYDDHGHGTHVAGTIAGSEVDGLSIGVAPGVKLIVGKVFGKYGGSEDKDLLLGMQWMADPDGNSSIDAVPQIVSNSWNVDSPNRGTEDPSDDPFCVAVETWTHLGIIGVFAAGNDGPDANTIGVPGACPNSVTVAATDSNDSLADFSSRGTTKWKSLELQKPDVAAPGVDIESAAVDGGTTSKSGTSMAAPHVAGVLALLMQGRTRQDEALVKSALFGGAAKLGKPNFDEGFGQGRVDVINALLILNH